MPTPFMHLAIAEKIRRDDRLPEPIRQTIAAAWPAFYLGNIAPDVQAINDMPRHVTHFYRLPPAPDHRAEMEMLATHPVLASPAILAADHAVFIAAYQAHLMLDLLWYRQVLLPYFVDVELGMDARQRFVIHNTLLTYLDQQALATLPPDAGTVLAAAQVAGWLPFVADEQLHAWRDVVAAQLKPGSPIRTVEIYAGRLAMTPEAFAANLAEPEWMADNVFRLAPLAEVTTVMETAVGQSIDLIARYLTSAVGEGASK